MEMSDPRDKRFYQLRKRHVSQLSVEEVRELIGYCDRMIEYVSDRTSRGQWVRLKKDYVARLP